MNYDDHVIEDMRLRVLQLLRGASGYDLNSAIISVKLERYGHRPSGSGLRTEITWLAEQGCVTIEEVSELQIATLTGRGDDAAAGRTTIPGIRRPAAGERA